MKHKILVVDDEEDLCEILQFNLRSEGFEVDVAYSAEEALELNLYSYSLILLDVMMGGIYGFSFAKILRNKYKMKTPIIFLTAKHTENDMLTGFNLGADDYISKPFSIKIVIARIKSVLKRSEFSKTKPLKEIINIGKMSLNLNKRKVFINEKRVDFTKKEFEILLLFIRNEGRVFSRVEIFSKIWDSNVIVNNRTIDVHIARIRKKIGKYGKMLKSRVGYGYFFENIDL